MRFLRTISALTAAAMLAMTVPAYADPPTAAPVVSPINKDQPAPFSGILLSPPAAAMVIAAKDAAAASLKLAVQHQYEVDMAQMKFQLDQANTTCTGDKAVLQAQIDTIDKGIADHRREKEQRRADHQPAKDGFLFRPFAQSRPTEAPIP